VEEVECLRKFDYGDRKEGGFRRGAPANLRQRRLNQIEGQLEKVYRNEGKKRNPEPILARL